ncbi:MAG: hypothetical protein ABI134_09830, partial [Byssovorax sp.]
MNTKLYLGFLATSLFAVAALQGCSDDPANTGGSGTGATTTGTGGESTATSSTGTGGGSNNPAAPALGAQIDRFGRPAINTALNHAFDADAAAAGKAKDAYNQDGDSSKWSANAAEFSKNLGILDSLDTVCGNQLLAAVPVDAKRYDTLAGALANDRIFVDTSAATCTTYLAVEANATGLFPNMDCGGRKLDYDVIDASYSALAAGSLTVVVGDGVMADADTKGTAFP